MKDQPFSIRWCLLTLLTLALTYVASVELLNALKPYHPRNSIGQRAVAALSERTETLVLGTSHVACGIDPRPFDGRLMCLATAAADYEVMELMILRNLERVPNLRLVLLEADNLALFNYGSRGRRDYFELYDYGIRRSDLPLTRWERLTQAVLEWRWVAPIFYTRRLSPRAYWRAPAAERVDVAPGHFVYTGVVHGGNDGANRIAVHETLMNPERAAQNLAALRRLLRLLDACGVRVVLVTLPHRPGYRALSSETWRGYFEQILATAREQLGPSFQHWDYEEDPSFPREEFNDGHHLNAGGTARFTAMLQERIAAQLTGSL